MSDTSFQVVILAGGECKRLYPLTSAGTVKALLPVGNRPLISYPLRNLTEAGIKSCIVVALGEAVSSSMSSYLQEQEAAGGVSCKVITVPEECGTADALRLVTQRGELNCETVVVYSGDLLTDLPVRALVVTHQTSGALATVLLSQRKTSPTLETKPGKAPRGVDYLGLDPAHQLLLFAASSPEQLRDIKLPVAAVQQVGAVEVHSDLQDQHLYVLSRTAVKLLTAQSNLSSLKLDFIPWLTRHQLKSSVTAAAAAAHSRGCRAAAAGAAAAAARAAHISSGNLLSRQHSGGSYGSFTSAGSFPDGGGTSVMSSGAGAAAGGGGRAAAGEGVDGTADGQLLPRHIPGDGYMRLTHSSSSSSSSRSCRVGVYLVPAGRYCARVNTTQAFGEVNREVAAADTALHLTGLSLSKYDNVVPPSVALGAKATVGPACIMGEDCVIGDKSSVKRTVMGNNCKLGVNVKVINCVMMDGVTVGDGCHIQNSIICNEVTVQERCTIKDCQVGPGFVVAQASEHKSETLAKT